jgi:hypothetical protein
LPKPSDSQTNHSFSTIELLLRQLLADFKDAALGGSLKFRLNVFAQSVRKLQIPAKVRTGKLLHSYGRIMNRDYLVVLEILGPIIFMAARIVKITSLKLDKIAASKCPETGHTLATNTHRTTIKDILYLAQCMSARPLSQMEIGLQSLWPFFQSREMHQASRMLEKNSLNIILWLLCTTSSDPTLNNTVCRKYVLPLLFRQRFLFLGLSERNFDIQIVVTCPVMVSWELLAGVTQ